MSGLATTVKIIDDPQGNQAKSEHANLLSGKLADDSGAGTVVPQDEKKKVEGQSSSQNVDTAKVNTAVLPAQMATTQTSHGVESVQTVAPPTGGAGASKVVLHGVIQPLMTANNAGVQVHSGHHGTTVTMHRAAIVEEVAPGVTINHGYLPNADETQEPAKIETAPDSPLPDTRRTLHAPKKTKKAAKKTAKKTAKKSAKRLPKKGAKSKNSRE